MNYYRKTVDNVVDNVRLKMQMGALTLKLSENNGNVSSNLSKINTNTSDISNSKTDISSNLSKIYTNTSDISSNLSKINAIENSNNFKISDEVFNNRYDIINQSFNFNENSHSYQLFEKVMKISTGELIINAVIYYQYDNLENDLNRLTHLYQFYNDKDELFYSITLDNHDFGKISNSDKNILNVSDSFCFDIDNKDKIKIVLSLTRINEWGTGNINLQMIDNNYINIIYNQKTDISNRFNEHNQKIKTINDKISFNNNLISNNFTSILPLKSNYIIDNIWLFNLPDKDINFKSDIKKILIYENTIDYQFKVNSFIEINESITYKYDNIKLYYYVLKETYVLMDQNDTILDEFNFNIKSKGFIFNNLHIYDNQYFFKVQSNITTLKLKVYLERISYDNDAEFDLQLNSDHQSNFVCLKYFKYTFQK